MRILLLSPVFHGYHRGVATALRTRGHTVTTVCYDHFRGPWKRLANKLRHEGVPYIVDVATTAAGQALASAPDLVLIIKGDLLGPAFWDTLERTRTPRVTWLYDELRRMSWTPERLRRAGPVATYSRGDAQALGAAGIPAAYVPMGFDTHTPYARVPLDAVTFIGALYANRRRLLETLHAAGVPVRAYGRDWSWHPFDLARTLLRPRPTLRSGRDVPRPQAYGLMAGSLASLNIHHDQDGFTPRTFEIAGVGGVQLIDRTDVAEFYDPGTEVAVFRSPEELVATARRAIEDRRWADRLRAAAQRRTLAEHTFDHRVALLEDLWG